MMSTLSFTEHAEPEDFDEVDNMISKLKANDSVIKFITNIATREEDGFNTINHEDVNKYDFEHLTFVELLLAPRFIRPYYDFDGFDDKKDEHLKHPEKHIKTFEEYKAVIDFLNEEAKTYGPFSLCGYTKDKELAESTGLRLNTENNHFVSFHVVFYTVQVKAKQWVNHVKDSMKKCCFVDDDVYKLGSRQAFRHGMSDKLIARTRSKTRGYILNGLDPETQIITIKGDEKFIEIERPQQDEPQQDEPQQQPQPDDEPEDEKTASTGLIILNTDELVELLNEFKPKYSESVEKKINCVFTAPAAMNDVIEAALLKWYNQVEHENGDKPIIEWLKRYRKPEESNKWYYTLLKHMDDRAKAEEFKNRFETVEVVKIERKTPKDLKFVEFKQFNGLNRMEDIINLLKNCVINMPNLKCWFSRLQHDTIEILTYADIDAKLRTCGIKKIKDRTAIKDELYTNYATEEDVNFDALFCGWKYENVAKSNKYDDHINKFKECIILNICSGDVDLFNYLMKRISFILHNPGVLSKVCVVLQGLEGTGKNWFTDIIAEVFGRYSSKNTNLSKLTARFNANEVIGRCYVVCNEALNADGLYSMSEEMKKIVERPTINAEKKGIDSINVKNALNVDITSNNSKPVLISPSDRRYLNIRTNPIHADDRKYWKYYQEELINEKGFYSDIYNMIYNEYNDENFLSLQIPETKAKIQLMALCANVIDRYIIKNLERFEIGPTAKEIKNDYKGMGKEDRGNYSESRFVAEVMNKCMEIYDKRLKCKRFRPTEKLLDVYAKIAEVVTDKEDLAEDDEEDDEDDIVSEWLDKNTVETDKFYYILSETMPPEHKRAIVAALTAEHWEYSKHITVDGKDKRGYKLSK